MKNIRVLSYCCFHTTYLNTAAGNTNAKDLPVAYPLSFCTTFPLGYLRCNNAVWVRTMHTIDNPVHTIDKTVYSIDETVHTIDKTVYSIDETVQTIDKTVHTIDETVQTIDKTVHTFDETVHTIDETVHTIDETVHTIDKTVQSIDETVYCIAKPVHQVGYTMHTKNNTKLNKKKTFTNLIKQTSATTETKKVFGRIRYLSRYPIV